MKSTLNIMGLDEGKLHFSLSLVFLAMCEITELSKGKKSDLSMTSMTIIRDAILEKISIGDIVRRNQISYGTATECVINLEKKGYVSRVRSNADGRSVQVVPTEKALKWFEEMEVRAHEYVLDGLSRLNPEERELFIDMLGRFTGYSGHGQKEESLMIAHAAGKAPRGKKTGHVKPD